MTNWWYLLLAVLIGFINNILCSLRWWVINNKIFELKIPLWKTVKLYFIGNYFNLFLPTSIGGDTVKGYMAYRHQANNNKAVHAVIIDRFTGLGMLMLFFLFCYPIFKVLHTPMPTLVAPAYLVIFGLIASLALSLLIFHRVAKRVIFIKNFLESASIFIKSKEFWRVSAIGLFFQFLVIINSYVISRSVGIDLGFSYFLLFVPIATLITMLPISLAGIGLREYGFLYFLTFYGISANLGVLVPLYGFLLLVILGIIGGVIYLLDNN